jgi:two-component system, OmpR family, response regulator
MHAGTGHSGTGHSFFNVNSYYHMADSKYRILLVEDDVNFGSILKSYLELNELEVVLKPDGKKAMEAIGSGEFQLCILDVMMPEMDGFSLAEAMKADGHKIPFIFLTAKTLKEDQVRGFRLGADDYITKPFDTELLLYKIRAILRRRGEKGEAETKEEFTIGIFYFNARMRILQSPATKRTLTAREAELLKMLCMAKDHFLLRKEALLKIWGEDSYFTGRSMDVFLARLRKYLKEDENLEIMNIHGDGYRLLQK